MIQWLIGGRPAGKAVQAAPRPGVVAALDIGSSKIACLIAQADGGAVRVLGLGHQLSRGLKSGQVVDMEAATAAVAAAVEQAERMAEVELKDVVMGVACARPSSRLIRADAAVANGEVGDGDIARVLDQGRARCSEIAGTLVHAIPVSFAVDGARGIRDPRGMVGGRLSVMMHVVTVADGPLANVERVVERCRLGTAGLAVAPLAAGLAVLEEDELALGATVIDMGGGATGIAVYSEGQCVFTDHLPIGGAAITADIARGLSTPLADAERMKTLYGSALASFADDREVIAVPQIGGDDGDDMQHIARSALTGIIAPRLEETFEHVRDRLAEAGFDGLAGRRIVLTGGASQLQGAREVASRMLRRPVRLGRPRRLPGLPETASSPAFAGVVGLLLFAQAMTGPSGTYEGEGRAPRGRAPFSLFTRWSAKNPRRDSDEHG